MIPALIGQWKMRKKKRINKRKVLTKKLDDVCRERVRIRDKDICQKCGMVALKQNSHPSHVYTKKSYPNMRHELLNIKLLCLNCHTNWWHKEVLEAYEWFKEKFPERYKYLQIRKQFTEPLSIPDLEDLLKELKQS